MKNLITKLLMQTITDDELAELYRLLNKPANTAQLETYIRDYHDINLAMLKNDVDLAYKKVIEQIDKKEKSVKHLMPNWTKYAAAAILVGVLVGTYMYKDTTFNTPKQEIPIIVNNQIEPGRDKATLTLETGETIALEKGTAFQTQNASSNGEEIIYDAGERNAKEVAYNYLTIPRGGQFQLTLSDGTKVWLNSETQLKYPVSFVDGESRQVELVYGEAYFEVSPSTAHKGANFKVYNNMQEVQVLGTQFNIKAYKDETHVYTTLVEGKVAVSTATAQKVLVPNQQSNLDMSTNNLTVDTVDVYYNISWKDGTFNFMGKPLKDIMQTLSRWYDMEVVFENKALEKVTFTGVLRKNQNIEEILSTIGSISINNYEIRGKTIVLK
jgi:hypothetical protein